MSRWIYKHQILELIDGKNYKSEDEFRNDLVPKLTTLFKIKNSQINSEVTTTSFKYGLSNRADIVISTDDEFPKVLIVIELKLSGSVDKFKGGDYEDLVKQLHKYSQDVRAPYGILLTDISCAIYRNKYFSYNQKPKRVEKNKLPTVDRIEDNLVSSALLDFLLYKKSTKYIMISIICGALFVSLNKYIIDSIGLFAGTLTILIVASVIGCVLGLLALVFKIFD